VTRVDRLGRHVVVTGTGELVNAVILTLAAAGLTARDVQLDSSSLEDAFVRLTGKQASTDQQASMNTLSIPRPAPSSPRPAPSSVPRPGPTRRDAFGKIVLNEARLTWRRPIGLIGGVGLPLALLVVFGQIPSFSQHLAAFGGQTIFDAYVPILAAFGVAMLALLGLPIPLVSYRELGVLRRLSTTPVPPSWVLAAQAVVQGCVAVAGVVTVIVVSIVAFGAPAPQSVAGLVLSVAATMAGLFAIGLLLAAVARTSTAANVIGRVTFFPLMFFAGLWLPRALMPQLLLDISNYTPLGAAVQAIQASMQTGFPPAAPLLVLAGYAVVFGYLARRFFRWE
jgi:ABC-2 type transport system permease protein